MDKVQSRILLFRGSIILLCILIPMSISWIIYERYEEQGERAEIIITQPNIDPWTQQYTLPPRIVIGKNLGMAEPLLTDRTEFIVCPESAIQEDIWHETIENSRSISQIRNFIAKYPNLNVVIGASTFRMLHGDEKLSSTARKFSDVDKFYEAFNTALFINMGDTIGLYHKSKLVPGPEKLPFQRLLRPLQNIAFNLGGTVGSLGLSPDRSVFTSTDGKFTVPAIICYESIYGEFVARFVRNGANLLFIITNDGWWGNSPGHKQHFSFAPLRAIETRRSVARSANTGISAFINQKGDIIEMTKYWEPGVIKADLKANKNITFYVAYGDYLGRIATFIAVLLILISITSSIVNKQKLIRPER